MDPRLLRFLATVGSVDEEVEAARFLDLSLRAGAFLVFLLLVLLRGCFCLLEPAVLLAGEMLRLCTGCLPTDLLLSFLPFLADGRASLLEAALVA